MPTIITGLVLLGILGFVLFTILRKRKKGGGCSGSCSGCSGGGCH